MNTNNPAFRVLKIADSNAFTPQLGTHRTKQVHVQFEDGTRTYIEVPLSDFNAPNVHAQLSQAAQQHAEVMQLRPGYVPPAATADNDPFR